MHKPSAFGQFVFWTLLIIFIILSGFGLLACLAAALEPTISDLLPALLMAVLGIGALVAVWAKKEDIYYPQLTRKSTPDFFLIRHLPVAEQEQIMRKQIWSNVIAAVLAPATLWSLTVFFPHWIRSPEFALFFLPWWFGFQTLRGCLPLEFAKKGADSQVESSPL